MKQKFLSYGAVCLFLQILSPQGHADASLNNLEPSQLRQMYVESVKALKIDDNLCSSEEAKRLHAQRRNLGIEFKEATPFIGRLLIYARNYVTYGDPLGPTHTFLTKKGYSPQHICQSAARPDGGVLTHPSLLKMADHLHRLSWGETTFTQSSILSGLGSLVATSLSLSSPVHLALSTAPLISFAAQEYEKSMILSEKNQK